ncbi:MAG: phosphonate ABC transporter, permease protein PhnE [Opitutae bacterium]|nr:phosphonate ABC transporter, permease protein PhnE [Opitutae bacterium]
MKSDPREDLVPWYNRLNVVNLTFLVFLLAVGFSLPALEGSGRDLNYWENLTRFGAKFFPPDLSILGRTLTSLWETFQIAVCSTFFAISLSLLISLGAAQNLAPKWLVIMTRMLLNMIRTVPSLLWALLAVVIVGSNSLAGVIALTFYSIGYLGKFYSEAFEAADVRVRSALRDIGASRLQAFQYGLWPNVKPLIWSHSLWMLEYNVRSASIIGYVGAGGIGLHLKLYADSPNSWDKFSTVLLCILFVVTFLDFLGERIRKRIKQRLTGKNA